MLFKAVEPQLKRREIFDRISSSTPLLSYWLS